MYVITCTRFGWGRETRRASGRRPACRSRVVPSFLYHGGASRWALAGQEGRYRSGRYLVRNYRGLRNGLVRRLQNAAPTTKKIR